MFTDTYKFYEEKLYPGHFNALQNRLRFGMFKLLSLNISK